ncbi:MAG: 50S ribosomal protein L29 [Candidatus Gracilibacteria bacterium]|jgi:large subunit ribosomal protein L29|nr:50S ribosomal protein L29 [Candidatus Gracilibacteria bacterium]
MKTLEELRKTETAKLLEELKTLTKELFEKKFEVKGGQAKDSHTINLLKTQIAQIKTILREKELNNKQLP